MRLQYKLLKAIQANGLQVPDGILDDDGRMILFDQPTPVRRFTEWEMCFNQAHKTAASIISKQLVSVPEPKGYP